MAVEIIFPRVDMDMSSGRVSRWLVKEGSAVGKGDPLFEIETDKAAMEIDAPASGVLRGIRSADGQEIPVGAAVGWIVGDGEAWEELPAAGSASPPAAAPDAPAHLSETPPPEPRPDAPLRATPLARREARRRRIDLVGVQGSGPRGRILVGDLPAAVLPASPAADTENRPAPPERIPANPARHVVYRQWLGMKQGMPVVFLHGFGSDQTSWRGVWSSLEATHRILAIDLPGHGRSEASRRASFVGLVDAVQAVLHEEGMSRVHLVGHSLGGAVALGLVEASAVDIRSLCLLAPVGLGPEIDGAFLCGLTRSEREESLAPWLRRLFADPDMVTPAFVRATLRGRSDASRAFQEALRDAVFADGTQTVTLRHVLERLTMPAKIIWGARDAIIPARQARHLPGPVALHTLSGGHMPQLEEPRSVAALIAEVTRSAVGERM